MKSLVKKITPSGISDFLRKRKSRFYGKSTEEIFKIIYQKGYWKESEDGTVSGPGSSLDRTVIVRKEIDHFVKEHNIQAIADIGCGDFNWFSKLALDKISYIGYDIVEPLVRDNQTRFGNDNIHFEELNIAKEKPSENVDWIICRDCLVHLSLDEIHQSLENMLASEPRFIGLTHFTEINLNEEIQTGHWRKLNFCAEPFKWPKPHIVLKDFVEEKKIAIWTLDDIKNIQWYKDRQVSNP